MNEHSRITTDDRLAGLQYVGTVPQNTANSAEGIDDGDLGIAAGLEGLA